MEIKTFIGRKLKNTYGILRRQIEIDRYLKQKDYLKLSYEYYNKPKNIIDFFSKRFILYPYYSKLSTKNTNNSVFHITFQYLADLGYYLNYSKTIITCHDIYTFITRGNLKRPWILQKYLLMGLKQCKYIIAISDFTKRELITKIGIPKKKIIVIKNAINQNMFYNLSDTELDKIEKPLPGDKKILHVGSEGTRKNFITLLKAFYLVKKKRKDIKLIRIGKPCYSNIIKSLNLENDIIYLNNISNIRLLEVYNLCDLLVFPSTYEGWGFPGVEAAACGLPVLCSDIPVFREVYKNFPLYAPPLNYKAFAENILKIISNEAKQEEMIQNGFNVIKNYKWEESSKKYLRVAKLLINNY
jgi:glycosyltransferase involved in cell wall biosynthesis